MQIYTRRLGYALAVLALGAVLSGCATPGGPKLGGLDKEYDQWYDGTDELIYGTEIPPATADEAVNRGDEAYRNGDSDRALYEYVRAVSMDDQSVEAWYRVGRVHNERDNARLAAAAYRKVVALDGHHAGAHEGLGLIELERRDYRAAEEHLRAAVAAEPRRWRSFNGLGISADLQKDHSGAVRYYNKALEAAPGTPRVLNNLGYSYYLAGEWDEAAYYYNKAVEADPDYERGWRNLALLRARQGRYHGALSAFRRVLDDPEAYNSLGYACLLSGEYERAEGYFRQALEASPRFYAKAQENLERARRLRQE